MIWEHFENVIAPEIRIRQIQKSSHALQQSACGLGQLVAQLAQAASKSEVHALACVYMCVIFMFIGAHCHQSRSDVPCNEEEKR